jgi:uncharacterized protein YaaR (DUF327 family)
MKPKKITSIEQLKKEASGSAEFFIMLNFNARSSKQIRWDESSKTFDIFNSIDDSWEELTEEQIEDENYTNIAEAIRKGAFYRY